MDRKDMNIFENILKEKKARSANTVPKYGMRKLSIGLVSCMLGIVTFMLPQGAHTQMQEPTAIIEEAEAYDRSYEDLLVAEETNAEDDKHLDRTAQDAHAVMAPATATATPAPVNTDAAAVEEFDGDQKKIRHVMYNCSTARPTLEGETNEGSREVQPETLSIQARPLPNGNVKARTGEETTKETYDGWYKSVYMPTETTVTPSRASVGGK